MLQVRDGYFDKTRLLIEQLRSDNNKPVVLMGHSMGNQAIHYFLNWMNQQPGGKDWLDHYVRPDDIWLLVR
jgi:triacylglycerol esterase/lipase EstA (alpha/beta hydrolase family)